jgi:broad specificity phosphatase PhoE
VRHAEKERGIPDPGLTPAGRRRAEALAARLGDAGLVAIFSSDYRRCQETVEPLAARVGIAPTVIEAADPHLQLAELRALPPGSAALLCGHANTVPALIRALGGDLPGLPLGMIAERTHDRIWAVRYPAGENPRAGSTTVEELRYGERS